MIKEAEMPVIRVSGDRGSGKTTLCRTLKEILNYEYIYVGGIFREMAAMENKTIEQFYGELESNPDREKAVDKTVAETLALKDCLLVEGRMAPFWPTNFKKVNMLLTVEFAEGVRRELKRPENAGKTFEEMSELSRQRLENERSRYLSLYGIENHLDPKHFDVVIDTTNLSPEQVVERALLEIRRRIKAAPC